MVSYCNDTGRPRPVGLVLILIVVEDGLVRFSSTSYWSSWLYVLILIVVEDGLVRLPTPNMADMSIGVLILIVVEDGLVRQMLLQCQPASV